MSLERPLLILLKSSRYRSLIRPALQIIEDAEVSGRLGPGSALIEAISGKSGMVVAFVAALKGYRGFLVMSEIQSTERRRVSQALGAELLLTPADVGTVGARIFPGTTGAGVD